MLYTKHAAQDDGELVELRRLARLDPSAGAAHVGYARRCSLRIDAAYVFVDPFRFISRGFNASRLCN
jgi:hypothetical protein